MFDEIVKMVKDQIGNDPKIASQIPAGQEDAVSNEIAQQVSHGIAGQAGAQGGIGGLLAMFQGGLANNSPITSAISGGLVGTLGSKFGLSPAITGAIAAALPGLLQKFAQKAADPNDPSITEDSITSSLSKLGGGGTSGGGLGDIAGKLGGLFK